MAGLFTPGADPARVYYGTDTRAQSLLIGAALALLLEGRRVGTTRIARRFLHTTAIGAALLLAWAWARTPDDATWLYRGGFLLTALLVAVVIASVTAETAGPLGHLLSLRPVRWIGLISYGLYLWHCLVIAIAHDHIAPGLWLITIAVPASFGLAALSWRVIERPALRRKTRWAVGTSAGDQLHSSEHALAEPVG